MANLAVVGAQWGDEGKGKVVDLLSERFDVVARFQGGPNAGHTVTFGDNQYALHHVPSGVFRPEVRIVIGNGTVIDLEKLLAELDGLAEASVELGGRLFISDRAHVILPLLKRLDALEEKSAGDAQRIGTTLRGIGPTYQAKAARWGLRMGDLADLSALEQKIGRIVAGPVGDRLRGAGEAPEDVQRLAREAHEQGRRLAGYVADTAMLLNDWIDEGRRILFEGAQGTMLDLDHGSYPFVTSSTTLAGGLCAGLGVAPTRVGGILGVFKAYATRVGSGPMPTELRDAEGDRIRERGKEFGTTTGRPRRCGWFDGVAARYANRINRFDALAVTLLDVLDTFDEIRICVGYELDGKHIDAFPASCPDAERIRPVYEAVEGWKSDTTAARAWDDLPSAARAYLDRLGEVVGAEIGIVGVGPDREQSIIRPGSWIARLIQE